VLRSIDVAGSWLAAQFDKPSVDHRVAAPTRPASSSPVK
jgi:hypothetical protein